MSPRTDHLVAVGQKENYIFFFFSPWSLESPGGFPGFVLQDKRFWNC